MDTLEFCTKHSNDFKNLFKYGNINYDRFIRTTDADHKQSVEKFWNLLKSKNYITSGGKHTGYYSVNEETFIMEKDLIWNDQSQAYHTELGERVELIEEDNYLFEFKSQVLQEVKQWLLSGSVKPDYMASRINDLLEDIRPQLSVSRPKERISWGITVPNDLDQTIYVWLDALVNYLTVLGYD